MTQPEYVFPAVVIQQAVPSAKSGVMVTTDVEGGGMRYLSIAVNEGVGGAVDGQATESLRVDSKTGDVQFLAQATASTRAVLDSEGGIMWLPASGTDAVLRPPEIRQLIELADEVSRFESLRDENGQPVPADIEFAFLDGRLVLLQIRPFVESQSAQKNAYLAELDAGLVAKDRRIIDLRGVPDVVSEAGGEP
jgi:phosphoenolpyruvate synthase/pyruvate phosphate dikinase